MARLKNVSISDAKGPTKELYQAIEKKAGRVPNIFLAMGNSPATLTAYLSGSKEFEKGRLTPAEREVIALAVSQYHHCNYCLSAHTALGKVAGLKADEMLTFRQAQGTDKMAQLAKFARRILERNGFVTDAEMQAVRQAGYTDEQITETIFCIACTTFTNFFNHVNDTEVDFPLAPELKLAARKHEA